MTLWKVLSSFGPRVIVMSLTLEDVHMQNDVIAQKTWPSGHNHTARAIIVEIHR